MNFLSRLFGKSEPRAAKAPEAILYKDCRIFPQPIQEGGVFRIAARIEKDFGGEIKTHNLIRADTRTSMDEAVGASADKARMAIDQLGDALFQ
jgi:hypothetical protein